MTRPAKAAIILASLAVIGSGMAVLGILAKFNRPARSDKYVPRPPGTITFTMDIAPIIFGHCSGCHRPGQSAPFNLLDYQDVKKHGRQLAEAAARRYMPPWLPEPGYGEFIGERTLTPEQIGLLQQWVSEGTREGAAEDLPPLPKWVEGWQLGEPDLVVKMPDVYTLGPEGKDIYRNFVIPIPTTETRYVRALEFQPGNRKTVHHAFIRFDRTRESRRLDALDPEPGFSGLHTPSSAETPAGQFLSWQPGKRVTEAAENLTWTLEPGTDLVLQMHLQPTGKPEQIQPSVGFYFADKPTTKLPFKIGLRSMGIDIPADKSDYFFEETFQLPVDADVLAVLPHAHYLGKELQGFATLPDGRREWLFLIKNWDFNWQGEYQYRKPMALPKGTLLTMHYVYDNSTNNVRNPNHPPQRVRYGLQSTDEMGEMWLQVLAHNTNDLAILGRSYQPVVMAQALAYNQYLLGKNPTDAKAQTELGKVNFFQGKSAEALGYFREAIQNDATFDEPHYFLGLMFRLQGRAPEAKTEFETALRLNPENFKAHGNLGAISMEQGKLDEAEQHFRNALKINPQDKLARENLDLISKRK